MKQIKRLVSVVAGVLIFCIIVNGLNYIYVSATDSEWERILWHNFYEDKGKIDNLYLGSSHVYCDLDPAMLDELNGQYNFNLSSHSQLMNGTYYLLREADRNNNLSYVYLELYYKFNTPDNFNDNKQPTETELYANWQNTDYMKPTLNKLAYMTSEVEHDKYPEMFLGFSRYRAKLVDWDYVKSTVWMKSSEDYRNFKFGGASADGENYLEYRPQGYWCSTFEYKDEDRIYGQERILEENPMAETSEKYFRKVIEYCQKRDIPITLFISPIYELQLISTENYDNYLNQMKAIAAEYNIDIYDFNLAKEEYLPIQKVKYFWDIGHLNDFGVEMYTNFFHKVMSGDAKENKRYFYNTYAEKLQNTAPDVYGIYYYDGEWSAENGVLRNMVIASNRDAGLEYKIVMAPGNGTDEYTVQDFSENKKFIINNTEHGVCTITYRMRQEPDNVQIIKINY